MHGWVITVAPLDGPSIKVLGVGSPCQEGKKHRDSTVRVQDENVPCAAHRNSNAITHVTGHGWGLHDQHLCCTAKVLTVGFDSNEMSYVQPCTLLFKVQDVGYHNCAP